MSWNLKRSAKPGGGYSLTRTAGDHLAHCQPCNGLIPCAYYESILQCLNVDVCGLQLCTSCLIDPYCGLGPVAILKPTGIPGLIGRHRLEFRKSTNYFSNVDRCRFTAGIPHNENLNASATHPNAAVLELDGWQPDRIDKTYSCSGIALGHPFATVLPFYDGDTAWSDLWYRIRDFLHWPIQVNARFMLIDDVLTLGLELVAGWGFAVNALLFRGYATVPDGWLDAGGVPTSGLTMDNVFTCAGNHCGAWEELGDTPDPPPVPVAHLDDIADEYTGWYMRFRRRGTDFTWTGLAYPHSGNLVMAVGGQVTIGAPSAVSPCTAGSDCTTTLIDLADCNGGLPEEPVVPTTPPVQIPYRAYKLCGGDGSIVDYAQTLLPEGSVIAFRKYSAVDRIGCYQLVGPKLLESDIDNLPITRTRLLPSESFGACDDCWHIKMVACDDESVTAWMSLTNFRLFGPVYQDIHHRCWTADEDTSEIAAKPQDGSSLVQMYDKYTDNLGASHQTCDDCRFQNCGTLNVFTGDVNWLGVFEPGTYTVNYKEGAFRFDYSTNWYTATTNTSFVVFSDGDSSTGLPGAGGSSYAQAVANSAGRSVTINHAGGKIGLQLIDDPYTDNNIGDKAPTWCIS